jgi:hypothetical protein
MAVITLKTVWLNLASEMTNYQSFPYMSKLAPSTERAGEDRDYANGRIRLVLKGARKQSFQLTLPNCTRAQINWLEQHTGELMLVRDDRGRKVWGTYFKIMLDENSTDIDLGDVDITFKQITHSEAV